jgi:hypothetical protein
MQRKRTTTLLALFLLLATIGAAASPGEGTRRITGSGVELFFMDDKLFGTANGHPLWAIYNCGADISGKIDIDGTYHDLDFAYHREGDRLITGAFGKLDLSMGRVTRTSAGFVYPVAVGETVYRFAIRYEKHEDGHLVNSTIEGRLDEERPLRLVADGRLCPFATTGIIMIAVGAVLAVE